ncbi:Copper-exporting P-type ATPase A [Anaerococcus prevotii]|uniref:Copper-exporting P-type ATPase n=1 Tax=Anaerococcus prevotii (strain ATCC 9321 / DSM 20548 / JCM 6508 / NCTC 11806 / PC1) TaxID=525919 RepID=C7RHQ4_ANAPD|nr:heavy metal translocating P-type ATPase [Anaerococcus prevotii]ACV29015.1 heavy metal translocating P-type ATPase [Anaerococcus prevotii DSM 20548]SUU94688.1 Copper-exporting P-type ATPase A [Anaerococcus prevotii]
MKERFDISGMTCASCQANVQKAVQKLGVNDVNVNLISESMIVDYDSDKINNDDIIKAVEKIGYGASLKDKDRSNDVTLKESEEMSTISRLKISFLFLIPLMYISMGPMINLPIPGFLEGRTGAVNNAFVQFLLALPVIFVNRKFFVSGFKGLVNKAPNMDTLVALGASAATIFGIFAIMRMSYALGINDNQVLDHYRHNIYFESSATILTLITLGKYFEARSKGETKSSLKHLMELAPKTARVIKDGKEFEVSIEDIKIGDTIIVRPGEAIPVDGVVTKGSSLVDQSAITGESIPVNKNPGDEVISASINKQGSFQFRAKRVGENTTISQIISLVNEANETKAPIARLADKIAAIFVPVVIVIAILTFAIWAYITKDFEFALNLMIAVLVISCPCALGLATPMAIMVATGKSAELGLLFKNAESLENLHKIDSILLDKTGTITEGKPVVTDVYTKMDEAEFISIARSIEEASEHPLSNSIVEYANDENISPREITDFHSITGMGLEAKIDGKIYYAGNIRLMNEKNISVEGFEDKSIAYSEEGKTSMYFANENKVLGLIAVQDLAKDSSIKAIEKLKAMGYHIIMLTGDNEKTAEAIRKKLDIDEKYAEVLPQDKDKVVRKLQESGKKVAMVGDGINDAPALARSDIGIAIGSGTDIAIDSADVVLIKNSLLDIVNSIRLSSKTIKIIKENLFWAFFYNIILIPVAAGILYPRYGVTLNPMFAALAMSISSVFVCLNSLRLRNFKPEEESEESKEENKLIKENKMSELNKMIVKVDGMSCQNCAKHVTEALEAVAGIKQVNVDLENKEANVEFFGSVDENEISKAISEAGYEYKGIEYK